MTFALGFEVVDTVALSVHNMGSWYRFFIINVMVITKTTVVLANNPIIITIIATLTFSIFVFDYWYYCPYDNHRI